MRRHSLLSATAALTALLALGGCRQPEITTYNAPKDPPPAISGMAASSSVSQPSALNSQLPSSTPAIRWTLPAGWTDQGANNIRLGNILVTGPNDQRAEMTVTRFEGDVGGDLANVNRWRGQLSLSPIDEPTLARAIAHLDFPAGHMDVVDLVSDAPLSSAAEKTRTLVAWLRQPDATWFFKLSGADSLVASQRDAFSAFLNSVEFSAPSTSATTTSAASNPLTGPLPEGHPPLPSASTAVSASPAQTPAAPMMGAGNTSVAPGGTSMANATLPSSAVASSNALAWSAPANWTEKPLGPVRKGSFTVRGPDSAEADLSITAFPGDVGGLLANLNRWRGELQLTPLTQAELPTATTTAPAADPALRFLVVDIAGSPSGTPTRTLGAILPVGTDTYFFKLKGPDATVAAAKTDFLAFLATVKTR